MRGGRRSAAGGLVGLVLLTTGCSPRGSAETSPQPWADRPVVELRFDVAADLRSVEGRETVAFTPDLDTCELVFRAWPNKPFSAWAGNSLVVSEVAVDGRAMAVRDVAAGAPEGSPAGTLLEVPLDDCIQAGQTVAVDLAFSLEFGEDVDERMGTSATAEVAWFATAFPLLAWERGRGWERGPAVPLSGETAVSEDFRLDSLEVVAPSEYAVLGTGRSAGSVAGPGGTTVHRFTAPAVRDVAVTVGDLEVVEETVGGVRVHLGLDRSVAVADAEAWLAQIAESQQALVDLLGPFPYEDLWVSVLTSESSGIEFPGAIQFGDVDPAARRGLVTHELAHMWFYGWVGNDQGEHPWLDESFATYAQMVADGEEVSYAELNSADLPPLGSSMTEWAAYPRRETTYYDAVYVLGGAALVEARERAGAEAFDAAVAGYLAENAHSVATPDDVREAFAELPEVLAVLEEVGALP